MSNATDFRGLEGAALKRALSSFISSHLPVLGEALRRGNVGTWTINANRFVFRYTPRSYSRLNTLLSLYKGEQSLRSYDEISSLLEEQRNAVEQGEQVQLVALTESEALLAMLYEAETLRSKLIGRKANTMSSHSMSWEDDSSEEQEQAEAPAEGLSVYLQDWYTYSKKGKKVSQEGLEIVLQAHEADDEEASAEGDAGEWST